MTPVWGANGDLVFDDTENETVLSLLLERPGWAADSEGRRVSRLSLVKIGGAATASQLENYAREALQVAVDSGRILGGDDLRVEVRQLAQGSYSIVVDYVTASGRSGRITHTIAG